MIEPYLMFIQGINMPQIFISLRPQHYTEIFNHTKYYPKTQPAEKKFKTRKREKRSVLRVTSSGRVPRHNGCCFIQVRRVFLTGWTDAG